jgi:MATE family, multidrug efflux pump
MRSFRSELRAMVRLAVPLVAVQVGLMLMGVVDLVMVGRVSATAIAAVAAGNLYFFTTTIFGMGALLTLDPVVAQAVGAGDDEGVTRGLQRGLLLAALLALPTMALLLPGGPVLRLLGQPGEVVPPAAAYVRIGAAGVLPFYVFVVLRQTLQAAHRVRPIVLTIVLANLANAFLNWVFIFGHFGLPASGVVGAAWATQIGRWLMPPLLLAFAWSDLGPRLRSWPRVTFERRALLRMLGLGVPIGIQHSLEYGVFAVAGLMMGWLGTLVLAGHQVALNLASLTFMVPLGISAAAAVLVGNAIGRGDLAEARRAAVAALLCGVAFMATSAVSMLALPGFFARLYTSEAEVAMVAATLIPVAGVFQVFDGLQVVSIGILRGTGDTRTPMLVNLLGFWLMGLPVSWLFGLRLAGGPAGVWWGLTLGLVVVAVVLVLRVRRRLARDVQRLVIDAPSPEAEGMAGSAR